MNVHELTDLDAVVTARGAPSGWRFEPEPEDGGEPVVVLDFGGTFGISMTMAQAIAARAALADALTDDTAALLAADEAEIATLATWRRREPAAYAAWLARGPDADLPAAIVHEIRRATVAAVAGHELRTARPLSATRGDFAAN